MRKLRSNGHLTYVANCDSNASIGVTLGLDSRSLYVKNSINPLNFAKMVNFVENILQCTCKPTALTTGAQSEPAKKSE